MSLNELPKLALNSLIYHFSFRSSWDYMHMPLYQAPVIYFDIQYPIGNKSQQITHQNIQDRALPWLPTKYVFHHSFK